MAITWATTIDNISHIQRREMTVSSVRDDGAGDVRSYTVTGKAKTGPEKLVLMDTIWRTYKREVDREAAIAALAPEIADLEAAANANLEARE